MIFYKFARFYKLAIYKNTDFYKFYFSNSIIIDTNTSHYVHYEKHFKTSSLR